jgi:hypothetical protein
MPVRKVSKRGRNIKGSFPSQIKGEKIRYDSTIERDLIFHFKFDPTVITYHAQPMLIIGNDAEGNVHTYIPDFLVVRNDSKQIIECKPTALIKSSHALQQIAIGQEWATNNNHDFAIVTDTNLRSGHTLENLKLLWRYSRQSVPTTTLGYSIDYMKRHVEGVSFQDLAKYLSSLASPSAQPSYLQAPLIFNMLFRHILCTELTEPITSTSIIWCCSAPSAAPLTYICPLSDL